jgi:hypothetical protein
MIAIENIATQCNWAGVDLARNLTKAASLQSVTLYNIYPHAIYMRHVYPE